MKNCSLVRKFGSCVGSATLALNLFSSVGSQSVAAAGSFLKSKFFEIVYKLISDDDLKVFNADAFWEQQTTKKGVNVDSLKKRNLIFLIKLKKFCDIMSCSEGIQNNKLKKEKINALGCDVEKVLVGDISEKIDEFFKSDFFKDNISCFTGTDDLQSNSLILNLLTKTDVDLFTAFRTTYFNKPWVHLFCLKNANELATTFFNRINMVLWLQQIFGFLCDISKSKNCLESKDKKEICRVLLRLLAYGEDLINSKSLTEDELYGLLVTCYQCIAKEDMENASHELEELFLYKRVGSFKNFISEKAQDYFIYKFRVVRASDPHFIKYFNSRPDLALNFFKSGFNPLAPGNAFYDTENYQLFFEEKE